MERRVGVRLMVNAHIKWILLVSGALTFTMVYGLFAPQAQLQSTFGATLEGPIADIVVRNWGALIALVGAMLIYSAFDPPSRRVAAAAAIASKLVFISLVLSKGGAYLGHQAGVAVVADTIMVLLLLIYLAGHRRA